MRMRRKKNVEPRLEACADWIISLNDALKGRWHARTGNRPISLEIGCGKGQFITTLARKNPEGFFVAVERVPSVLVLAVEKAKAMGLENLLFLHEDAEKLCEHFAQDEVSTLYLNFSDPWPAKRHAKRRLTHARQLAVYDGFLRHGGAVVFKTDNAGLFEFSLCSLSQFGYGLEAVNLDLHASGLPNVQTEYEQLFAAQGMPIHRLAARKP